MKEREMSRKVLSLVLVLAVAIGAFSAVSAQDDMGMESMIGPCPEGEATVTVAVGAVGAELETVQGQADRYMEMCSNITVELLEVPDSATERLGLYQQFWEAESSDLDVYQVDVIWAGIIAEHMIDFNEYASEEYIGEFFPNMIDGQTIDGRLVALPWFTDAAGLYYRTDLLEKYGLEVPETWADLEAAAQTIQEGEREETGNQDFFGYVWQGNAYEGLTCDAHEWLISATGNTFITPEGEVTVNDPAFVEFLETAADWVGGISPEAVTTYQEEESRAVWQAGNAAFMRNWPYAWGLGNEEDSPIAGNFEYVPLPVGESGQTGACLGGWQLGVTQYSDNVDAAAHVAKFLASPDEQLERAIGPFGANPTIPALYEDERLLEANPLFERMGPILETAVARPSGVTAERYNEASTIFFSNIHDVLTGQTDAQTAVEDIELDLEDLLAEMGMDGM
jgi:trehalose/maltose transport system substrate-binding protein